MQTTIDSELPFLRLSSS